MFYSVILDTLMAVTYLILHVQYFALTKLVPNPVSHSFKISCVSVALDTILHGPRLSSQRRHSVSVCQTPTASQPPPLPPRMQKMISVASNRDSEEDSLEDDDDSLCSSPRRSLASDLSSPEAELSDIGGYSLNTPAMHANLHTEFIHSVSRDFEPETENKNEEETISVTERIRNF